MSPLPETKPTLTTYTSEREKVDSFFSRDIGANEVWNWYVYIGGPSEQKVFFESMRVNLNVPLESYITGGKKEGGLCLHRVYPIPKEGVYLELIFDDLPRFYGNVELMLKLPKEAVVHRFGENINEQYLASITTG